MTKYLDAGQNPPDGVVVHYYLKEKPEGEVTLTFLNVAGEKIRTFSSEEKKGEQAGSESIAVDGKEKKDKKEEPRVPKGAGANRFVWNMRYADPIKIEGYPDLEEFLVGPFAPPGTYRVQLKVGDQTFITGFQIHKDPRIATTQEELQAQFELLLTIRDKLSETHNTIKTVRDIRRQVEEWERRAEGHDAHETVVAASKPLKEKLTAIEGELFQAKAKDQVDMLDFPIQLNAKFAVLANVVASGDTEPTRQAHQVFEEFSARLGTQLQRLRELIETDVASFE